VGIDRLPVVTDPSFTGQGNQVLFYTGDGGSFTITHEGKRNFTVGFTSSETSGNLANEISNYSGRVLPASRFARPDNPTPTIRVRRNSCATERHRLRFGARSAEQSWVSSTTAATMSRPTSATPNADSARLVATAETPMPACLR